MKSLYAVVSLFLILNSSAFAQKNFKSGYLISLNGDTLRGEIDTREWARNPRSVNFKNSAGKVGTFTVNNTLGFGIDAQTRYDRYVMQISIDELDLAKLSTEPKRNTDTILLRRLISGPHLTLYNYTDHIKTRYIIVDAADHQPHELDYHILIDSVTNKISKSLNYRGALIYYANLYAPKNSSLQDQIMNVGYNDDMIYLVNEINGGNKKGLMEGKTGGIRFYGGVSLSSATLKYSGGIDLANDPVNDPSTFPGVNIGLDILQNAAVGKLILRAEVSFTPYHAIKAKGGVDANDPDVYTRSQVQQQTFSLSPQIIYNVFNKKSTKIFTDFGINVNLSSYKDYVYSFPQISYTSPIIMNNYPQLEAFWYSFHAGAGVTLNEKVQLIATYNRSVGLTAYGNFSASLQTFRLGINYLLKVRR